jgi:hypothetical protein
MNSTKAVKKKRKPVKNSLPLIMLWCLLTSSNSLFAQLSYQGLSSDQGIQKTFDRPSIWKPLANETPPALFTFFQPPPTQEWDQLKDPHQAFFCRMEWAWEKRTQLPIKFRLGSYEYTNWLEGKPVSPISVFDQ